MTSDTLLQRFENGAIDVSRFGHREHVLAAWEMLRAYPFIEAMARYSRQLQRIAISAGAPEKFNLTVTLSFLSLIAEAIEATPEHDFDDFYSAHPELGQNPLKGWYSNRRLDSDLARKIFLMPDSRNLMTGCQLEIPE